MTSLRMVVMEMSYMSNLSWIFAAYFIRNSFFYFSTSDRSLISLLILMYWSSWGFTIYLFQKYNIMLNISNFSGSWILFINISNPFLTNSLISEPVFKIYLYWVISFTIEPIILYASTLFSSLTSLYWSFFSSKLLLKMLISLVINKWGKNTFVRFSFASTIDGSGEGSILMILELSL